MNAIAPTLTDLSAILQRHITYAGPHPAWDGWQVKLLFGRIHVSIAYTQYTEGIEMLAYDVPGWNKPRTNLDADEIKTLLLELMQTYAPQETPMSANSTQVIVDEGAKSSLALLNDLQNLATVDRVDEGIYIVHADEKSVNRIANQYQQAVIKVDAV